MIALLVYKDKTYKSLDSKNNNFKLSMDFMQNSSFNGSKELDFVYVINGATLPDDVPALINHLSSSDKAVHSKAEENASQ